jgi:hypothetical protein
MKRIAFLSIGGPAAATFLCVLLAQSTTAATFNLNPSLDAFVAVGPAGSLATNNYGGAGVLAVASSATPKGEFQSVLQFDLSTAKTAFDTQFGAGQWTVQSMTLQFTASPPNNAIFNGAAAGQLGISWMQNDSWVEGTGTPGAPATTGITYNILQSLISGSDQSLGTFAFNGATNGTAIYTLGLTSGLVNDLLAGSNASLRLFAADSTVSALFNSRNFGTVGSRPVLTIAAVPEPGALALGAAMLGVLVARRTLARRKLPAGGH